MVVLEQTKMLAARESQTAGIERHGAEKSGTFV
jgi:hypothetical protein